MNRKQSRSRNSLGIGKAPIVLLKTDKEEKNPVGLQLHSPNSISSRSFAASISRILSASCLSNTLRSAFNRSFSTSASRGLDIALSGVNPPAPGSLGEMLAPGDLNGGSAYSPRSALVGPAIGDSSAVVDGLRIDLIDEIRLALSWPLSVPFTESASVVEKDRFRAEEINEAGDRDDCLSSAIVEFIEASGASLFSSLREGGRLREAVLCW